MLTKVLTIREPGAVVVTTCTLVIVEPASVDVKRSVEVTVAPFSIVVMRRLVDITVLPGIWEMMVVVKL